MGAAGEDAEIGFRRASEGHVQMAFGKDREFALLLKESRLKAQLRQSALPTPYPTMPLPRVSKPPLPRSEPQPILRSAAASLSAPALRLIPQTSSLHVELLLHLANLPTNDHRFPYMAAHTEPPARSLT